MGRHASQSLDRESLGLTEYQFDRAMAVPWRRAILRFKPRKMRMGTIYRAMGWTPGLLTARTRYPNLRVTEAARLADVVGANVGEFLAVVAEELRIEELR